MNVAVSQGADAGKSFFHYVEYLAENGFVPPNGRGWIDHIQKRGNETTHEIIVMSKENAEELISFVEMLLKFLHYKGTAEMGVKFWRTYNESE